VKRKETNTAETERQISTVQGKKHKHLKICMNHI